MKCYTLHNRVAEFCAIKKDIVHFTSSKEHIISKTNVSFLHSSFCKSIDNILYFRCTLLVTTTNADESRLKMAVERQRKGFVFRRKRFGRVPFQLRCRSLTAVLIVCERNSEKDIRGIIAEEITGENGPAFNGLNCPAGCDALPAFPFQSIRNRGHGICNTFVILNRFIFCIFSRRTEVRQ